MDVVPQRISLIYTTNNEKNLAPRCARKKIFKSTFRVSSQISVDLHINLELKYIYFIRNNVAVTHSLNNYLLLWTLPS